MIIAIAGNIGSGKSYLAELLSQRLGWTAYFDNTENPYIGDFYEDMRRYALNLQVYFLGKRLEQLSQIRALGGNAIVDRTIYEDAEVFARNLNSTGLLSSRDWLSYKQLYDFTAMEQPLPDLLIYLRATPVTLVSHIQRRGRSYEASIQESYLQSLNELYEQWMAAYGGRVIVVDVDQDDFVVDTDAREKVLSQLAEKINDGSF